LSSFVDSSYVTPWYASVYSETMKRPIQISFRVTEEQARQLDQRRGRRSRGECARRLMDVGLEGHDSRRLLKHLSRIRTEIDQQYSQQATADAKAHRQIEDLAQQLHRLREDLAMATAGLLTNLGRTLTKEEAEDFVRRTLLSDSDRVEPR